MPRPAKTSMKMPAWCRAYEAWPSAAWSGTCASGLPISVATASGVRSACASIGSRSSTPYRRVVSIPFARSARAIASRMTGPRNDPTWTVPDGVFESLTTCGPESRTRSASSSAQSMASDGLADANDLVREVARRHLHDDLLTLLLAEEGAADRTLVGDTTLGGARLGRSDDREGLLAIGALDRDRRPDLDVVGRVVLVEDRRVLDERLERLDPTFDERLLVLGVLVLRVLGQVAVLLRIVDAVGDLGTLDRHHLLELGAKLLEAVSGEVCRLVVHAAGPRDAVGRVWADRAGRSCR